MLVDDIVNCDNINLPYDELFPVYPCYDATYSRRLQ